MALLSVSPVFAAMPGTYYTITGHGQPRLFAKHELHVRRARGIPPSSHEGHARRRRGGIGCGGSLGRGYGCGGGGGGSGVGGVGGVGVGGGGDDGGGEIVVALVVVVG